MEISVIITLFAILFIPASSMDAVLKKFTKLLQRYRSKSLIYRARRLIMQVTDLSRSVSLDRSRLPQLAEYKFFHDLVYKILDYSRTHGGPIRESLKHVRQTIIKHYRFDVEIQSIRQSSLVQMFLSSFIIWAFTLFTSQLIDLELSSRLLLTLSTLQVSGFIVEKFLIKFFYGKYLLSFEKMYQSVSLFQLLYNAGVPLNQSVNESNVFSSFKVLPRGHSYFETSFQNIMDSWKKYGGGLTEDIEYFLSEVSFAFEGQLQKFKKTCVVVQFTVMVTFFFPCFFLLIRYIMKSFELSL